MMPLRFPQGEEPAKPSIPPRKNGPPMEPPSEPGTDLCKRPSPHYGLALKDACRRGAGWSQNLCPQHRQQQLRSICEPRRHNVRLADTAGAIVIEIPVKG